MMKNIRERVQIEKFLKEKVYHTISITPEDVVSFYEQIPRQELPDVPRKYVLFKISYTLTKEEEEKYRNFTPEMFFAPLYTEAVHAGGRISLEQVESLLHTHYSSKSQQVVLTPLISKEGDFYLTTDELTPALLEFFEQKPRAWCAGSLSKTYSYKSLAGKKIIELIYIAEVIPSHAANLRQDYHLLARLFLEREQTKKLQAWLRAHRSEVVIVEPEYQELLENW